MMPAKLIRFWQINTLLAFYLSFWSSCRFPFEVMMALNIRKVFCAEIVSLFRPTSHRAIIFMACKKIDNKILWTSLNNKGLKPNKGCYLTYLEFAPTLQGQIVVVYPGLFDVVRCAGSLHEKLFDEVSWHQVLDLNRELVWHEVGNVAKGDDGSEEWLVMGLRAGSW